MAIWLADLTKYRIPKNTLSKITLSDFQRNSLIKTINEFLGTYDEVQKYLYTKTLKEHPATPLIEKMYKEALNISNNLHSYQSIDSEITELINNVEDIATKIEAKALSVEEKSSEIEDHIRLQANEAIKIFKEKYTELNKVKEKQEKTIKKLENRILNLERKLHDRNREIENHEFEKRKSEITINSLREKVQDFNFGGKTIFELLFKNIDNSVKNHSLVSSIHELSMIKQELAENINHEKRKLAAIRADALKTERNILEQRFRDNNCAACYKPLNLCTCSN